VRAGWRGRGKNSRRARSNKKDAAHGGFAKKINKHGPAAMRALVLLASVAVLPAALATLVPLKSAAQCKATVLSTSNCKSLSKQCDNQFAVELDVIAPTCSKV